MARKLLIGCVVLVVLCVIGGVIAYTVTTNAIKAFGDTANNFMVAVKDGNYDQAYSLCSAALQKQVTDANGIKQIVESQGYQPQTWTFNNFNSNNGQAVVSGTATFSNGKSGTVELTLTYDNNTWKIDGFKFNPSAQ